jgi:hypothetical protein
MIKERLGKSRMVVREVVIKAENAIFYENNNNFYFSDTSWGLIPYQQWYLYHGFGSP